MKIFDFSIEFISKFNCDESKRICDDMIRNNSFVVKNAGDDNHRVIVKNNENILFINSFSPIIKIVFYEENKETKIMLNFQVRPAVKILFCVFIIMTSVFEMCLINLYLNDSLISPLLLLLPPSFAFYAWALPYFGLRVMSNPIKHHIVSLLNRGTVW